MTDFSSPARKRIHILSTVRCSPYTEGAMAENSGVTASDIEEKLKTTLEATHVEIEDMSGKLSTLSSYSVSSDNSQGAH